MVDGPLPSGRSVRALHLRSWACTLSRIAEVGSPESTRSNDLTSVLSHSSVDCSHSSMRDSASRTSGSPAPVPSGKMLYSIRISGPRPIPPRQQHIVGAFTLDFPPREQFYAVAEGAVFICESAGHKPWKWNPRSSNVLNVPWAVRLLRCQNAIELFKKGKRLREELFRIPPWWIVLEEVVLGEPSKKLAEVNHEAPVKGRRVKPEDRIDLIDRLAVQVSPHDRQE